MRVCLLGLLLWAPALATAARPTTVELVVLGAPVRSKLIDAIEVGLRAELGVHVVRLPRMKLPKSAWYPPRRRYRADQLLVFLARQAAGSPVGTRILGITRVDISTTKGRHADWGVFGLADLGGPAGVISTFRLRRNAKDAAQVTFRVVSTAIHETGHTLGLPHCTEPRCVMQDAEGGITNTDTGTGALGPGCRARLK